MVDVLKSADNKENKTKDVPAVIVEQKEPYAVEKKADAADDEMVATLKKQLNDAEEREKSERSKRIEAEKGREEANTKAVSSQGETVKAHEVAIANAIQVATGNITTIKRELKDAIEGGDLEKQLDLQEKLSDARWDFKEAEKNKKTFDAWKDQQKNVPLVTAQNKYTDRERSWIKQRPDFEKKGDLYEATVALDAVARAKGIDPSSDAYYDYINTGLERQGFDDNGKKIVDNGRDNTGDEQDEEETVAPAPKTKPKLVVAAPASYSAPSANSGRRTQQYKLSAEQRDMAHRTFGPNSSHKLSEQDAEAKYAARQMEIRDRRANGEKI